ncbi:hypothetical protein MRX96_010911 [Rhipicephalus microplus]
MSARIRVRKEQNIALVSTSDPDLAVQLCHVQTLKLGSRSNAGVEIVAFSTQVNTTMVAFPQCLTCGSDEHPTIDLGCPTRQRRPGPRVLRDERPLLEKPNDPPLKQLCEQLPTNNQPRSGPQHASSEGHGRSARSKRSKTPKHGKSDLATYSNPEHLHLSRHLRIHPGTTHRLLHNAVRKATIRGQHFRNESPPMHRAWRIGEGP